MTQPQDESAIAKKVKEATSGDALLQTIVAEGKVVKGEGKKAEDSLAMAKTLLTEFVSQLGSHETEQMAAGKRDTIELIKRQIARIDDELSKKVDEILHNKDFRDLEASWRGLHYLVFNTETSSRLKLRLLNVDPDTLAKDLSQAADVDQSALFKKVYEEEYGTYGGNPFSLLIADYYFDGSPENMQFLKNLSKVASAAHTPMISAASADLFGWDSFTQLADPRDLSKIFEKSTMAPWRSFRESEDARYVTLTLPRFLLRLPYGDKTVKVDGFSMNEDVSLPHQDAVIEKDLVKLQYGNGAADGPHGELLLPIKAGADQNEIDAVTARVKERVPKKHDSYLWGNAAYALGQRITNAFALYGWCAAIRGPEGGGMVRDLSWHTFETEEGDVAAKCPTEIAITDRREKELDSLGFVALCHRKGENYAAFFGGQTIHKPQAYATDAANANALISARLPYLLAASRFAHYLKVMCRDKIGSFQTKGTISEYLNRWIMGYVLGTDDAGQELKAQYPLREARVDVFDIPGKPGAYKAVVFLRPHFQLEELTASIRLVAELPPPVAA